ncbi:MAG: L-histidine N(alpha)-methyltransferase [Cyanobacteria bacterium J06641_5]
MTLSSLSFEHLLSSFSHALDENARRIAIATFADETPQTKDDGRDVIAGLTAAGQKSLPSRYFYDDRGSEIFEQICELPEYYLTRTETALLQDCADEIARLTGACQLLELGSGSSTKTRLLLDAYARLGLPLQYAPIDVSAGMLIQSAHQLVADYPTLGVLGLVGTYEQALAQLPPCELPARLLFFIGSSLGNFAPQQCDRFFERVTTALEPGDYFLLGIDLQKDIPTMEAAYNDAQGVTAEFNYNLLDRLNRQFNGNFQRDRFEHWTFYNAEAGQIETYLRSRCDQTVRLEALDLTVALQAGEPIHTEISRKFDLAQMQPYLRDRGLVSHHVWTDARQWYALVLCQMTAASPSGR